MAINASNRNDYTGNGATAIYPYTFKIFAATDLLVTQRDTDGAETELHYPTDFSVSGVDAASGGSITLTAGNLASDFALSIRRVVPLTQETVLTDQRAFFADEHEDAFDRAVMVDQQQQDLIDRALKFNETESGATGTIPFDRAGMFLAFDVDKNPVASSGTGADAGLRTDLASGSAGDSLVAFRQLGTGAVTRSGRDKLREVMVSVKDFDAVGDGVTDDTAAIARAYASISSGIVDFPPGVYKTTGTLTPKSGVTLRGYGEGSDTHAGATVIAYQGTDFWIKLGAIATAHNFKVESMSIVCSGSALGFLRVGDTAGAFNDAYFRIGWRLRHLWIQHTTAIAAQPAGAAGILATQYIDWKIDHITINNFTRPDWWDRGGNSPRARVRRQGFKFGTKWTDNVGAVNDTEICPEFLGPSVGAGGTPGVDYGYAVEIAGPFVTFINALYELQVGGGSQGHLHITNGGGNFIDYSGVFANSALCDKLMVLDNGYDKIRFYGTSVPVAGYPAIQFGTPYIDGSAATFTFCSRPLNVLVAAQPNLSGGIVTYHLIGAIGANGGMQLTPLDTVDMGTDVTFDSKRGMFWNNDVNYGIFRPAGAWPQSLNITWQTDIVIDPGGSATGVTFFRRNGIAVGTNPAQSGAVRVPNNQKLVGRNQANGADVDMLLVNTANEVQVGTGANIRWGTAPAALGGGAAATLGTIGGTGPAGAPQNKWLKVIDSAGGVCFIPVWI